MASNGKSRQRDHANTERNLEPFLDGQALRGVQDNTKASSPETHQRIDQASVDQFGWCLIAVHNHFQHLRGIWARQMEVTAPQFAILTAVRELDRNDGVSVSDVSTKLLVDASFVTTQSKALEKLGLLRRVPSKSDARVVLMSLTDKARKLFASLSSLQEYSISLAFAGWTNDALLELNGTLQNLAQRLARTGIIVATDA